jgi:hypothetical protein
MSTLELNTDRSPSRLFSLTPGFSRVLNQTGRASRFNGLFAAGKPLKRFSHFFVESTGLKPGVNENRAAGFAGRHQLHVLLFALFFFALPLWAQPAGRPAATNDYASDIGTVHEAQAQALEQARQMLAQGEGVRDRGALEAAIKEMERAETALEAAKKSAENLPAALAAEQAAYQALLKVTPRETRVTQSRGGQQGGQAGQAGSRELSELDMQREENRYETESQAAAPQNEQQREQSQTADRLKQLAQRQQDLNDRLRELQTALQAARTDEERADLQRQLKRLQEEQRQMLASVDEMRQQLAQSPNADSQAETQRQLEQTRSDMERAAQNMERQSPSEALAAGTRAQEAMQNLRDDLQKRTSSQFAEQMRQLRSQARDLTQRENEIARGLETLNNGERQTLDDSAERQRIVQQMAQQQNALTNLLAQTRAVTEQSEATEPLLSQQLYDTLRRADQMHMENLLQTGSQLTERGFLPQASQVERMTRTNLTELAGSIDRAADSVLGSETDALRYAQRELDALTRQVERELGGAGTNATASSFGTNNGVASQSNLLARAAGNATRSGNTNSMATANGRPPAGESQSPVNNSRNPQRGNSTSPGQNGNRGQPANGNSADQASAENQPPGEQPAAGGNNPGRGNQRQGNNTQNGDSQRGAQEAARGDANGSRGRLRQLAVQLGSNAGDSGPITGGGYLYWSDRLRGVEQVVDQGDLRNQLATVRERVSAMRAEFRQSQRQPDADVVRQQIVVPLTQVRVWLQDELARRENADSLAPLDRDPVPDNYAELVRQYYEKLGSAQ